MSKLSFDYDAKWGRLDVSDDEETFHPGLDKNLNIRVNRMTRDRKEEEIDEQKKVLESCEMQKNCIALGGSKANCNIKTMCSSGNPANGTRPCKTCASMFKLQKWKQLHPTDVKSQCGSNECHPTPMTWRLCSTTDNATVCPEAAINVKPALVPDSDVADSHCTSCFEGDSLEIVHPATQTGFCRSNGPADGSAMIAPPRCHSINDLVPNVSSPVQVCTQIQRPHVVIPATPADGWLKGYNEYTYATCNSRKVLVCKPSDDPLSTLVRPASGGPKEYQSGITQCNTESAVRCVTACRLHLDGTICKKGEEDKCRSNTSWNYTAWQKARDKLLEKPQNLEGLDCDAARCTNQMCESLALHV